MRKIACAVTLIEFIILQRIAHSLRLGVCYLRVAFGIGRARITHQPGGNA